MPNKKIYGAPRATAAKAAVASTKNAHTAGSASKSAGQGAESA